VENLMCLSSSNWNSWVSETPAELSILEPWFSYSQV